jgi:hypothetical protein
LLPRNKSVKSLSSWTYLPSTNKSKIDNNGWDPELYPDYWEIIEDNPKKPKKDKNKEKKH